MLEWHGMENKIASWRVPWGLFLYRVAEMQRIGQNSIILGWGQCVILRR